MAFDVGLLRKLLESATPGPWLNGERILPEDNCVALRAEEHADIYRVPEHGNCNVACANFDAADADLVVAARNALPELLNENERLKALCSRLRESLRAEVVQEDLGWCEECCTPWKPGEPEAHEPDCIAAPEAR